MSSTTEQLWSLTSILRAAVGALEELEADQPFLERLVRLFTTMPVEDQEPILGILTREVAYRVEHPNGSGQTTGPGAARVNPGATLYLRVYDGASPADVRQDEVAAALIRASKIVQMVLRMAPDAKKLLADTIARTFLSLSPDEREAAELCVDTIVAIRKDRVDEP